MSPDTGLEACRVSLANIRKRTMVGATAGAGHPDSGREIHLGLRGRWPVTKDAS